MNLFILSEPKLMNDSEYTAVALSLQLLEASQIVIVTYKGFGYRPTRIHLNKTNFLQRLLSTDGRRQRQIGPNNRG